MINHFINAYKRLIQHTDFKYQRYLYQQFSITNRLTGLVGARGTGKTTLLLQYIKQHLALDDCIYVSLDHIYFSQHTLVDFVQTLYDYQGVRYFFFDEAHKYPHWNQELKNLYDMYPDIHLIFSGSSSLDLVKGSYDLSRRGVVYQLAGMSFREYLLFSGIADLPQLTLNDLLNSRHEAEAQIASLPKLLGYFHDYLGAGYYPFLFEDKHSYAQKLQRTVEKTIYEDIANHYQLKTESLLFLKKILSYMATTPPNTLNINNIAKNIGLTNKTVQHYLTILEETNMVSLVSKNQAGSQLLKRSNKIYLNNADLYQVISEAVGFKAVLGTKREVFFINMLNNAKNNAKNNIQNNVQNNTQNSTHTQNTINHHAYLHLHYGDEGDFNVTTAQGDICFEIGGKNKTTKQIRNKIKRNEPAYLIKDNILYGSRYDIPLYLFGFLY